MTKKFTLIELLVVIAIIAILASMLLPALTRAKASGYSSACKGQLKQSMLAMQLYANQSNDWMFSHMTYGSQTMPWAYVLVNLMKIGGKKDFVCPANKGAVDAETWWYNSYGFYRNDDNFQNNHYSYWRGGDSWSPVGRERGKFCVKDTAGDSCFYTTRKMRNLNKIGLIADSGRDSGKLGGSWDFVACESGGVGHVAVPHNDRGNMAYADGRVDDNTLADYRRDKITWYFMDGKKCWFSAL